MIGLAVLFLPGAGGDTVAARQAASQMLAAYNPQNHDELRLAGIVTSFSFRALQALGQAAAPDLPISRMLQLSGSAVSLSREAAKAERRLTELRKAGQTAIPLQAQIPERVEARPTAEPPTPVVQITPVIQPTTGAQTTSGAQPAGKVAALATANGTASTQVHDQRQRDLRIAASVARAEAKFGPQVADALRAETAREPTAAQAL